MKLTQSTLRIQASRASNNIKYRCFLEGEIDFINYDDHIIINVRYGDDVWINSQSISYEKEFIVKSRLKDIHSSHWLVACVRQMKEASFESFGIALRPSEINASLAAVLNSMPTDLHALCYVASHPHLIHSIGNDPQAAREHYRQIGWLEQLSSTFRPFDYAATHPDLFRLIPDPVASVRHYIATGFQEQRPIYFDAYKYGAGYPDLAEAYGLNRQALAAHYARVGFSEGRNCDQFDWHEYAQRADLANVTPSQAARHFLLSGGDNRGDNF